MAYWYWRTLKQGMVLDENTTNRFDLPSKGAVSGLRVRHYGDAAKHLDTNDNIYPVQMSDIRVVGNGNFDVINARARQLHAIDFWDRGVPDPRPAIVWSGWTSSQEYFLPFGRYLGDPLFGLHLGNFKAGVQMEETNEISITNYTDKTSKLDVYALMRKNPESGLFGGGFLRKRQIVEKTAASETQYPVTLPTENKLKQIHLFSEPTIASGVQSTTIFNNTNRLWLSILTKEEYIINNMLASDFAFMIHAWLGRLAKTTVFGGLGGTDNYLDTMIYERQASYALPVGNNTKRFLMERDATMLERAARMYGWDENAGPMGAQQYLLSTGICLHGDIPLLMQEPKSGETDWLDAKANAEVRVEVTEGASTGKWYIVLDELEKIYPS